MATVAERMKVFANDRAAFEQELKRIDEVFKSGNTTGGGKVNVTETNVWLKMVLESAEKGSHGGLAGGAVEMPNAPWQTKLVVFEHDKVAFTKELEHINQSFKTGVGSDGALDSSNAIRWLGQVLEAGAKGSYGGINGVKVNLSSLPWEAELKIYENSEIEYKRELARIEQAFSTGKGKDGSSLDEKAATRWLSQVVSSGGKFGVPSSIGKLLETKLQEQGTINTNKPKNPSATPPKANRTKDRGKFYETFSGTDMIATIVFPNAQPLVVGELTTVSYSIYRDKHPVRTLGRINTKGFTKGPRTVAGTLIFTVFQKHVVNSLKKKVPYMSNMLALKTDELPPFDLYITMANEYGASSRLNIYGLTIVDEGKVMSVEDMFTENQWSYMARDIVLMDDLGAEQNVIMSEFMDSNQGTGTFKLQDLVLDDDLVKMNRDIAAMQDAHKQAVEDARVQQIITSTPQMPSGIDGNGGSTIIPPPVSSIGRSDITISTSAKKLFGWPNEAKPSSTRAIIYTEFNVKLLNDKAIPNVVLGVEIKYKGEVVKSASTRTTFEYFDRSSKVAIIIDGVDNVPGWSVEITAPVELLGYGLNSNRTVELRNPAVHMKETNPLKFIYEKNGSKYQEMTSPPVGTGGTRGGRYIHLSLIGQSGGGAFKAIHKGGAIILTQLYLDKGRNITELIHKKNLKYHKGLTQYEYPRTLIKIDDYATYTTADINGMTITGDAGWYIKKKQGTIVAVGGTRVNPTLTDANTEHLGKNNFKIDLGMGHRGNGETYVMYDDKVYKDCMTIYGALITNGHIVAMDQLIYKITNLSVIHSKKNGGGKVIDAVLSNPNGITVEFKKYTP